MALPMAKISPGFSPGFAGRCAPGRHEPTPAEASPPLLKLEPRLAHPQHSLCDPRGCSPPGSSVHGIPQASRNTGMDGMPSSRGSS